jgi:Holliday junction DNA helicase RuvA
MIAFLKGKLVHLEPTQVVVEVNGVGYQLQISLQTFSEIKEQENIMLHTHLAIREDAHLLYGFSNEAEKKTVPTTDLSQRSGTQHRHRYVVIHEQQ